MSVLHPSARYIYYLFSRHPKSKYPSGELVKHLGELGLPVPQDAVKLVHFMNELDEVRPALAHPPLFQPRAVKLNHHTESYLHRWKIAEAWMNDPAFIRALDILKNHAELRRALCIALLGPLQRATIAERFREHFGFSEVDMNPRVVMLFEHYFWSSENMDLGRWHRFLGDEWHPKYLYMNDYLTALHAPRDMAGAVVALYEALRSGSRPDNKKIVSMMKSHTFGLFLEAGRGGSRASVYSRAAALSTLWNSYRDMTEEEERMQGGDSSLIDELRLLSATYDDVPQKTFRDLPHLTEDDVDTKTPVEEQKA